MTLRIASAEDAHLWRPLLGRPGFPGWTDDYASILPLLEDWQAWLPGVLEAVTIETARLIAARLARGGYRALHPPSQRRAGDALARRRSDAASSRRAAVRERFMVWQETLGFTFWAVERKEDGELLGFCGLKIADDPQSPVEGEYEVGWRLREDAWGQGYAKEAAAASLDFAFDRLGAERVVALTVEGNAPSWGLMLRLGMTRRADLDYDTASWADGNGHRLRDEARAMAKLIPFGGKAPRIDPAAFVAPGAVLIGDIEIGPEASIWYNCVLRGDVNHIRIGARTNIQDGSVLHVDSPRPGNPAGLPTIIGEDVLIGHMAMVHGCILHDRAFVGLGRDRDGRLRDRERRDARRRRPAAPGRRIPAGQLWAGRPAKYVRDLSEEELAGQQAGVAHYVALAKLHAAALKLRLPEGRVRRLVARQPKLRAVDLLRSPTHPQPLPSREGRRIRGG